MAVVAPGPIVETSSTFEKDGWSFEATQTPLWATERVEELIRERKLCGCDGMPDMFCGDSVVRCRHLASGVVLELSAADAFRCCSWDPPPPALLQPPPEAGSAEAGPLVGAVRCQFAGRWRPHIENPDVKELEAKSDWTCSSAYWGSLYQSPDGREQTSYESGVEQTQESLPLELLRSRDEISWFQEVLLWEDELSDNGLCRMSIKIRVMPSFWFALMLCELRVDNVLIREIGTRFFCSFGSDRILREWTFKESTYDDLRKRGAMLSENTQISGESVGSSLLGPQDIKRQLRHEIRLNANGVGDEADKDNKSAAA